MFLYQNDQNINYKQLMQPIPSSESPTPTLCPTCNLEPLPQSTQYLPLLLLQFLLLLISVKISAMVLLFGYCISKTVWICPLCKKQAQVQMAKNQETKNHVILRLNDCMVLVGKTKFRIAAAILIALLGYMYYKQPKYEYKPMVDIQKTWKSLSRNCGYDAYIENSYRFKYLYSLYEDTRDWQLQAVYIGKESLLKQSHNNEKNMFITIKMKMIPTQFVDSDTEDIQVIIKVPDYQLEKGDVVKVWGEWSGHKEHILVFLATKMEKTNKKILDFGAQLEVLPHGLLRQHSP